MVVMGSDANSKPWQKKMALTKPHLQFIHNLRVTSMQFVPTPWFPTLVSKKKTPRFPTWNGISAMCQDLKARHSCPLVLLVPATTGAQVPCTWSTGSVATVQWRVPSAAPESLSLLETVRCFGSRRIGIGRYINRRMKMCSLWEIRCFTRGYQ